MCLKHAIAAFIALISDFILQGIQPAVYWQNRRQRIAINSLSTTEFAGSDWTTPIINRYTICFETVGLGAREKGSKKSGAFFDTVPDEMNVANE